MAGLLKQLQRHKPLAAKEERGAVVRSSLREASAEEEPEFLSSSGFDSQTKLDAAALLLEPDNVRMVAQRNPTINSAIRALAPDIDNAPWWLTEEAKPNPQVEALIVSALRGMDLTALRGLDERQLKTHIQKTLQFSADSLKDEIRVTRKTLEQTEAELIALLSGKGPLEPLFEDVLVTEIFVDHHQNIRAIRRGHAVETPFKFRSAEEYSCFVKAMLQGAGRALTAKHPIVDAVLDDKWRTRVNAIDATLVEGEQPRVCFRIPRTQPISFFDVLQTKTLPATVAAWMAELVALAEANILVIGPDGAGKTVMTTAMLSAVGSDERVITIEDVPEIFVPNTHLEKLSVRPSNGPGFPGVPAAELLRTAMRRSPHRLVIGELSEEVSPLFLNALETGFPGSIATILADTAEDGVWRMVDLIKATTSAPFDTIVRRIARSIHLCVTMRKVDGAPCLYEISEIGYTDDGRFHFEPILRFAGVAKGKRQWQLQGRSSRWLKRLREKGLHLMPGPSLLGPEEAFTADETEE